MEDTKKTVGNSTKVSFPEIEASDAPARIDTGARLSSIWGSAKVEDGRLLVVFFGKESPLYSGKPYSFDTYEEVVISSSMGQMQKRYMIVLLVRLRGKKIRASFTIADRSKQVYPVLIGRNILRGKFIVDVKKGKSLRSKEMQRTADLQAKLKKLKEL